MPGPVQSIERAAAVLRLLAGRPALGLAEIATALDLAKGTAHGILTTLRSVGFVEQDRATGRYRLGDGLARLSAPAVDPHELRARATNLADSLAATSGLAVRIAVLDAGHALVVHHVFRPDNTPQRLDVGTELPLHAHALGKVLLAYDPAGPLGDAHDHAPPDGARAAAAPRTAHRGAAAAARAASTVGFERCTHRTATGWVQVRRMVAQVRAQGWADDLEEYEVGQGSVAAPLRGQGGLVVGALAVCGAVQQLCGDGTRVRGDLVAMVQAAAVGISRDLGA